MNKKEGGESGAWQQRPLVYLGTQELSILRVLNRLSPPQSTASQIMSRVAKLLMLPRFLATMGTLPALRSISSSKLYGIAVWSTMGILYVYQDGSTTEKRLAWPKFVNARGLIWAKYEFASLQGVSQCQITFIEFLWISFGSPRNCQGTRYEPEMPRIRQTTRSETKFWPLFGDLGPALSGENRTTRNEA